MTLDPIRASRELSPKRRIDWSMILGCLLILVGSMLVYLREVQYEFVDFRVHTMIAGDFDFADLHTITSRGLQGRYLCAGVPVCGRHELEESAQVAGEPAERDLPHRDRVLDSLRFPLCVQGRWFP